MDIGCQTGGTSGHVAIVLWHGAATRADLGLACVRHEKFFVVDDKLRNPNAVVRAGDYLFGIDTTDSRVLTSQISCVAIKICRNGACRRTEIGGSA